LQAEGGTDRQRLAVCAYNGTMILNVSSRTDIPAYYLDWFFNRIKAGYVDVRNPFHEQSVSRIFFENVDAYLLITKDPRPLARRIREIDKPCVVHVTITGYHGDLEPGLPDKREVIESLREISSVIGRENVYVRYDPVLLNERYTVEYHKAAFERLASQVSDYAAHMVISFLDDCKNVRRHQAETGFRRPEADEVRGLAESFARSAERHGVMLYGCNEREILAPLGFRDSACFSQKKAFELTGRAFGSWKARNCGCVEMVDIGYYNSCPRFCKYCYANYDESRIAAHVLDHDPDSSLLSGHLRPEDVVKRRVK